MDTTGAYYGQLCVIKTLPQAGGAALLDTKHTWDAGGNLATRQDVLLSQTETFTYDALNRLTGVTGPYSENYTFNAIGNILSKNGTSYTYGSSKPHAVTAFGSTNYTYDSNGNMLTRGNQTITWDVENRPVSVSSGKSSTAKYESYNFTNDNTGMQLHAAQTFNVSITHTMTQVKYKIFNDGATGQCFCKPEGGGR